jgi:hypothetical protein
MDLVATLRSDMTGPGDPAAVLYVSAVPHFIVECDIKARTARVIGARLSGGRTSCPL